jgi:bacteriochlorophyll 4-vinyl reductase
LALSADHLPGLPNQWVAAFLLTLEDLLGKHGLDAALNLAGCKHWIGAYPPDNMEGDIPFSDFSRLNASLQEIYGGAGAGGMARRAGAAIYNRSLARNPKLIALQSQKPADQPLGEALHLGLETLAEVMNAQSAQGCSLVSDEAGLIFRIERCPACWDRSSSGPVCSAYSGLLRAACDSFVGEGTCTVSETSCRAAGSTACEFRINLSPTP